MAESSSRGRRKRQSGRLPSHDSSDDDKIKDPDYKISYSSRRQLNLNPPQEAENQIRYPRRQLNLNPPQESAHQIRYPRKQLHLNPPQQAAQDNASDMVSNVRRKKPNTENVEQKMNPATIFSWMIENNTIEENGEVVIMITDNILKKGGKIRREGIQCDCCNEVLTPEEFHIHGGGEGNDNERKPYERILVVVSDSSRKSLLCCMKEALNHPDERKLREPKFIVNTRDNHDFVCILCGNGGDLICCDKCSSTYHSDCLGIPEVPGGLWYCSYCVCKFCGESNDNMENKCHQCGKKYHLKCCQGLEQSEFDLNILPHAFYCDQSCVEVSMKLEKTLLGVKNKLGQEYSWTLLHHLDHQHGINYIDKDDQNIICYSKLAVARRLLEDSLKKLVEYYTKIDIIKNIVYNCGSNFNRIDFSGFYTAILEKHDQILCVAALRIHDARLAEMPFIATHKAHSRKGMRRMLLVAIESLDGHYCGLLEGRSQALCSLNIEKLIIQLIPEKIENWKEKYGFCILDDATNKQLTNYNTVVFGEAVRLQKILLP